MNFKALFSVSLFISTMPSLAIAKDVVWFNGHDNVTYSVQDKKSPVVNIALKMFSSDIHAVTGMKAKRKI